MRRTALTALLLTAILAAPGSAREYVLDLADDGGTLLVEPGTEVTLNVIHRLPAGSYRYEVRRAGLLPALDDVRETGEEDVGQECDKLLNRLERAGSGNSESVLRSELIAVKARSDAACLPRIERYEAGTRATLAEKVIVGEGQVVTIHVTRIDPPGADPWVFEINTGEDRRWLIHYGFSFLPDEDDEFFTRASQSDGENGGFVITRSADRSGAEFEPIVTFTYLPKIFGRRAYVPNFTAGLGADIDERLVFAGLSWVIGDNVNLFVGAAGHEQTRLKGIYQEGQVLQEMLSGDQLVDDTFELNAIVGVGFRFGKNPFKKEAAVQPAAGEPGEDAGAHDERKTRGKQPRGAEDPSGEEEEGGEERPSTEGEESSGGGGHGR